MVRTALSINSPTGKTYAERIDKLRTEREMRRDLRGHDGEVPMGKTLFGNMNPVRTGGPMQVSIAFAEANTDGYPYPIKESIRHGCSVAVVASGSAPATCSTTRPSIGSPLPLCRLQCRLVRQPQRSLQAAVSQLSGKPLALDGDLIRYDSELPGKTELAVHTIAGQLSPAGHPPEPEARRHQRVCPKRSLPQVFVLADRKAGSRLPTPCCRASLKSPKITRNLTTAWFAKRVQWRQQTCLKRLGSL